MTPSFRYWLLLCTIGNYDGLRFVAAEEGEREPTIEEKVQKTISELREPVELPDSYKEGLPPVITSDDVGWGVQTVLRQVGILFSKNFLNIEYNVAVVDTFFNF